MRRDDRNSVETTRAMVTGDYSQNILYGFKPRRTVHSLAFPVSVVWTALRVTHRLIHNAHVHLKTAYRLQLLS